MELTKFQLKWRDGKTALDPRVSTDLTSGNHFYRFEAETKEDAEAIATTFMTILGDQHNFQNHELTVVRDEEPTE